MLYLIALRDQDYIVTVLHICHQVSNGDSPRLTATGVMGSRSGTVAQRDVVEMTSDKHNYSVVIYAWRRMGGDARK